MKPLEVAIQALNDIANPLDGMKRNLKPGEELKGVVAVELSRDPFFLRNIARRALIDVEIARIEELKEKGEVS